MLKADKDEDLGRMFELVSRIPDGLSKFMVLLEKHIEEVGLGQIEKLGDALSSEVRDNFVWIGHIHRENYRVALCFLPPPKQAGA